VRVLYADIAGTLAATGMVARGGFAAGPDDGVPPQPDGTPTQTVVVIGNVGGAMWPRFRAAEQAVDDPLDTWTRAVLAPIAASVGATFVHPSDEPFQPFQRWAQRAEGIAQSPISILIHPQHGLWHAYRGAFLFPIAIEGLPPPIGDPSPCLSCADQPCLSACPVDAFTIGNYDADACRSHVRSRLEPVCIDAGCAARLACPIGTNNRYGPDQMNFHMKAFVGE
jgi:ferredoxin